MVAFNKFDCFVEDEAEGKHNLGSDTLKVMLTNSAPSAANTVKGNITEITAGNGYTAGGTQASQSSSSQTSGLYKLVLGDVVFTCVTAAMAPWRYAVLYNDTSATDALIGWWDRGSSVTLQPGDSETIDFDPTTGAIQKQ
jgi:hypothetical protein